MSDERVSRRSLLKFLGAGTLGTVLAGLFGYTYSFRIEPHWLTVEKISIPLTNLPPAMNGLKIVCLSDFHHEPGDSMTYLQRVVQTANRLQPDVVCLLGDYVFSKADTIHALSGVLSRLKARFGVFAVLGNHDYWTDPDVVRATLQRARIKVLINQGFLLEVEGDQLLLAGLDDGWSGAPDTESTLLSAPAGVPAIILMHEPDFADHIASYPQVVLQLSGHSHGGQVKPLFLDAPILPAYARNYPAGLYVIDQMYLYVTRGIGVIPPMVRFNCRPEVTQIVLTTTDV